MGAATFEVLYAHNRAALPSIAEELTGIAEGAKLNLHDAVVSSLSTELSWFARRAGFDVAVPKSCSDYHSLGQGERGLRAWVHNEDGELIDANQSFLIDAAVTNASGDSLRRISFVYGHDILGGWAWSINSHGVAHSVNALYPLNYTMGIANSWLARHVAGASSLDDAVARACDPALTSAGGQNFNIGSIHESDRQIILEVSPLGCDVRTLLPPEALEGTGAGGGDQAAEALEGVAAAPTTLGCARRLTCLSWPSLDNPLTLCLLLLCRLESRIGAKGAFSISEALKVNVSVTVGYHANLYVSAQFKGLDGGSGASSEHRMARMAALPPADTLSALEALISDTHDPIYPIHRTPTNWDPYQTLNSVSFDVAAQRISVWGEVSPMSAPKPVLQIDWRTLGIEPTDGCRILVVATEEGGKEDRSGLAELSRERSQPQPPPLPRLQLDASRVSIGGISSGADFAANYLLAHSSTTLGAAIWAGNAPRCYTTRAVRRVESKPTHLKPWKLELHPSDWGSGVHTLADTVPIIRDRRVMRWSHAQRSHRALLLRAAQMG